MSTGNAPTAFHDLAAIKEPYAIAAMIHLFGALWFVLTLCHCSASDVYVAARGGAVGLPIIFNVAVSNSLVRH